MRERGLFAQRNPLEEKIKATFYNGVVGHVFGLENVTQENLPQKLQIGIQQTMRDILNTSKNHNGIMLPTGQLVSAQNCPAKYKKLFTALLTLNKQEQVYDNQLAAVAGNIMQLDSFQELNPTQFIMEANGWTEIKPKNIQYDFNGVTPELIRATFYNEMVVQAFLAVENDWLSKDDLEDQEPKVFFGLPALTLLEAILQSKDSAGIRLLNGKAVTMQNCPQQEGFAELVGLLLSVKDQIKPMTGDQLNVVKHILCCGEDLPEEKQHLQTKELMQPVSVLKDMAIEITRRKVFQETVSMVIDTCCDSLDPPKNEEQQVMQIKRR